MLCSLFQFPSSPLSSPLSPPAIISPTNQREREEREEREREEREREGGVAKLIY